MFGHHLLQFPPGVQTIKSGMVMSKSTTSGRSSAAGCQQRLSISDDAYDVVSRFEQFRKCRADQSVIVSQKNRMRFIIFQLSPWSQLFAIRSLPVLHQCNDYQRGPT